MLAPCLQTVMAKALAIEVAQWYQHAADFLPRRLISDKQNPQSIVLTYPTEIKIVHCLYAACEKWHMDNLKCSLEASGNIFKSIVRRVVNTMLDFMQEKTCNLQLV